LCYKVLRVCPESASQVFQSFFSSQAIVIFV